MIRLDSSRYFGDTRNGFPVFDRWDSHFHPEGGLTLETLKEGLRKIDFPENKSFHPFEVSFDHNIGYSNAVEVTENDDVIMLYRKNRNGKTPIVMNRKPEPSNALTIILKKDTKSGALILVTAFIGAGSTPEPWDKKVINDPVKHKAAVEYWSTHALVYTPEIIDTERN